MRNENRTIILVAAVVSLLLAGSLPVVAEVDGTIKLGGIARDEQSGDLSAVQETYNIYTGFNVSQFLLNGRSGTRHYLSLDLRDINLASRKGNLVYRVPGTFRLNSNYRQNRWVYDPDRTVTSDRYRWGVDMAFTPTRSVKLLADYNFNMRDGDRLGYPPGATGSWLGTGYDYTHNSGGVEAEWVFGRRSLAARYDFTLLSNRSGRATNRRGSLVSARFSTPCAFYDKWNHFVRGAYGVHDLQNSHVHYSLLNFQYIGIVKPVWWFKFRYNFYMNRIDDSATRLVTTDIQNNFDADVYYKFGRLFGGYGYESNDDDLIKTHYNTYAVGGTFNYERSVYAKVSYSNRAKTDPEKLTLLRDIDSERFRADLKLSPWESLVIGGRYSDGQRLYPDIDAGSEGYWANGYLSYDLPVWLTLRGDYSFRNERHNDRAGRFDIDTQIFTTKFTFDRVEDLYLGFGASYVKVFGDLFIQKYILNFEGDYRFAKTYHVEVKYNVYNYDDYVILSRHYASNVVWFNFGYDFNV